MIVLAEPRQRRRPSLTPMIDVVFLLLVFFMLAARLGPTAQVPIDLASGGQGAWSGPPRLVEVGPTQIKLNGRDIAEADLVGAVLPLVADPADPVLVRPEGGATLQHILDVMDVLNAGGLSRTVLIGQTP